MTPPSAEPEKCPILGNCNTPHKLSVLPNKEHPWEQIPHEKSDSCSHWHAAHSTPAAPAETRGTWECTCEGRNQKVWNADPNCEIHGEKSPPQPSDDVEPNDERAEFEKYARLEGFRLERKPIGDWSTAQYEEDVTQAVWETWQARASLERRK